MKPRHRLRFLLLFLVLTGTQGFSQSLTAVRLRCEGQESPMGIESASPRLSWQLASGERSVLQTAYRVLVSDDPALLAKGDGNVWDSKRVASDKSIQVKLEGGKLQPAKTYYWKVMVWDNHGHQSPWSNTAKWQTGLFSAADWKGARWIAYEKLPDSLLAILPTDTKKDKIKGGNVLPLMRKTFTATKTVKKATAFVCGLGQFEFSLNGKKVGDHFLDPGWTKYDKQALYVPFDVTKNIQSGTNAIGVMLGNGFYYVPPVQNRFRKLKTAFGYPKLLFRLLLEYCDGSTADIVSDETWKTAEGPLTFSSIYGGEDYDATREQPFWNKPAFDDRGWKIPVVVDGPPQLNVQAAAPLKIMDTFAAQKVTPLNGSWMYDFGQNASGIVRLSVRGKKGDTVRLWPAEILAQDGTIAQRQTGTPYYFEYVLKGSGVETWEPRFTYYGFRYVQVSGAAPKEAKATGVPELLSLQSLHTRNAAATIGSFRSSNDLFNQTFTLVDWAVRSNTASVFTDCPHREKLGWLEQDHLMGESIRYTYDALPLFRKVLDDIRYSQSDEGLVPEIAPEYLRFTWGGDMFRDSPEWGSTAIILPWYLYQWYGDEDVLAGNYDVMKRYLTYLKTKARGHILSQGLGDWYDLGPKPPGVSQLTPMGVTGTAIYYYDLGIVSKIARMLGKEADANRYEALAVDVKKAFNDTFFHADTKQYATGSQTANAMAVFMNLVEPQDRQAVIENLVADIRSRKNALTAGDIGYRYVLCVLHDAGRDDVIFDMNSRTDVPGYGYQLAKGATALTESWSALLTNSNNHLMLGHIIEWFYRGLGGLGQDPQSVAGKRIVIDPRPVGNVTSAQASYESPYGTVKTAWKKGEGTFELTVQIPANATATVFLPASGAGVVKEGKTPLAGRKDVIVGGRENGRVKLEIGSGTYRFSVTEAKANLESTN